MSETKIKRRFDEYNRPVICEKCGGRMLFKGVGEYRCEDCGETEFDDYGKVRNYIEKNPKQTMIHDIEANTGVSRRIIRQLLRDERIQVASDSKVFLQCEVCRVSIRSGRYCAKCAALIKNQESRPKTPHNFQGYGQATSTGEGAKRFKRER